MGISLGLAPFSCNSQPIRLLLGPHLLPHSSRLKERQSGRRHYLLQQLNPFAPLLWKGTDIYRSPGDIAAGPCQARYDASFDRTGKGSDNWNCSGRRFEIEDEIIANGNDQIRIAAHNSANQLRIMRSTPLAGISLDQEIPPFDIA